MKNTPSLLPCPFCGANAHFEIDDARWEWIECEGCGMQSNRKASLMEDCKPMLAGAWNTRAKQGQPAHSGEPVAWLEYARRNPSSRRLVFTRSSRKVLRSAGWVAEPLYTAPQPVEREPLTPSQYNMALGCATDIPPSRYEAVTRAIERAHGITQKGGSNGL